MYSLEICECLLFCPKLTFMFVSSPCFVLHTLYSVMQVNNENVYPEQSVVLLARYRKLVLRVKFLGTKDFVPQLQQHNIILYNSFNAPPKFVSAMVLYRKLHRIDLGVSGRAVKIFEEGVCTDLKQRKLFGMTALEL